MSVSDESFFASKSMILIVVGIAAVVMIFAIGSAVKVIWHQDVFSMVGAAITGVTAHTTGGIVRNIQTDTPARIAEVQSAQPTQPTLTPPPTVSATSKF